MTIDEAIENLRAEKRSGTKSVIIAWWNSAMFNRKDDKSWEHAADMVERKHDWSSTQEDLAMSLDLYRSE